MSITPEILLAQRWEMINELRRDECDSIELNHDNPDFEPLGRNCAVTWRHMTVGQPEILDYTFYGVDIDAALLEAVRFARIMRQAKAERR